MQKFINCLQLLENQASDVVRMDTLASYFGSVDDDNDKVWACALFLNKIKSRPITLALMTEWALENQPYPAWLFESSLKVSGDLGETIALIMPENQQLLLPPLGKMMQAIEDLKVHDNETKKEHVKAWWSSTLQHQRRYLNKMLTGSLRTNVSAQLLAKTLSNLYGANEENIYHTLTSDWKAGMTLWKQLMSLEEQINVKAYPFMFASDWREEDEQKNNLGDMIVEYLWKGVRVQVVKRMGKIFLWNKAMEAMTVKYNFLNETKLWPDHDFVVDGHIVSRPPEKGVKKEKNKYHQFIAYDVLEYDGKDVRNQPLNERRALLTNLVENMGSTSPVHLSPVLSFDNFGQLREAITQQFEGFMLKRTNAPYNEGRENFWFKFKALPFHLLAVVIYAQKDGRTGVFNEFTLAVWQEEGASRALVPVARIDNQLDEEENKEMLLFIKNNTIERFGPVYRVAPAMIFEISFKDISASKRHKSGISLDSPFLKKWVKGASLDEIGHLHELTAILPQ